MASRLKAGPDSFTPQATAQWLQTDSTTPLAPTPEPVLHGQERKPSEHGFSPPPLHLCPPAPGALWAGTMESAPTSSPFPALPAPLTAAPTPFPTHPFRSGWEAPFSKEARKSPRVASERMLACPSSPCSVHTCTTTGLCVPECVCRAFSPTGP